MGWATLTKNTIFEIQRALEECGFGRVTCGVRRLLVWLVSEPTKERNDVLDPPFLFSPEIESLVPWQCYFTVMKPLGIVGFIGGNDQDLPFWQRERCTLPGQNQSDQDRANDTGWNEIS
ncbi:hypothetical protein J3459_007897 [Metarhizium acridum]|uniref:uncharacterized protein n=1 Tax=Metarhizium acridum TaxID=92637 RepID=UPI001C6D0244|nr:hypothetical protein J3458_004815 [Metarhizium acridum]KAG8426683.1 hypothetical protein J3459_007897 [Metarhizium acridum]